MQNTTADYKIEINKPSRSFECKITIGNNIYTNEDLVNLTLEYTQPQEGFSIGNTISQSLDLTLLNKGDIIYSTSQIKVEIGLKIGSTIEYILMGIFNIDDIEKTDYTTKFTAYDNMIKFETPYYSSLGDKLTLQQVVNELSSKTGVQFTGSLPSYTVSKLDGFSCREVLSYVASICGGNAFITRDGKFTIKNLGEVEKSIDGSNYFEYTREEVKYKVGQISCQVDENNILSKGSIGTESMELGFENPWVTETIITEIYNKLNGLSYLGYSMKWQGDISLDPYDIITVTDVKNVVRKIPILSQKLTYTGGLTSEIGAKGETKNKNSFSSSGSTTNKVNRLVTEQAVIKEALIEKANIQDLEAVSIRTQTLEAKTAKIEEAIIDVAYVSDLTAINANIQTLFANDATINNALINKADVTELNAINADIETLSAKVGEIDTLVSGNISSENIQTGGITGDNLNMNTIFVNDANIIGVNASKINAGSINTNNVTIQSENGGIVIADNTQQFKDKNGKVRVQIGQDAKGDFNFGVFDSTGSGVLIDATGVKEKALADGIIKDRMIGIGEINGSKIDINSLITEVNKDTNTNSIKASKVLLDTQGQKLDVAFNSLKNQADETKSQTESNTTQLGIEQGKINTLIQDTTIVKDGQSLKLKDEYSKLEQTVSGINTTVGQHTTTIQTIGNKADSAQTTADNANNKIDNLEIGGRNLIIKSSNLSAGYLKSDGSAITTDSNWYYTDFISVTTGKQYIASGYKNLGNAPSTCFYDSSKKFVSGINNGNSVSQATEETIKKDKRRIVTIPSGCSYMRFSFPKNDVDNIKLEIGNKATDWTPAPEDVDASIEDVAGDVSTLTGKVTTVENNYSTLSQDLSGFKTTVGSTYSTKSELSTVDNKVSSLTSRVSTAETSINQLNDQIVLKVEATDVTEAINNIQVGGRNLLIRSLETKDTYVNTSGSIVTANGFATSDYIEVSSGEILAFSKQNSTTDGYFRWAWYKSDKTYISRAPNNNNSFLWEVPKDTGFVRISYPMDAYPKVEKGNKVTDWSPAPEDVDSAITSVDDKVTTTSNKVATIETNLSSINLKVQSTETTVSSHTTQLSTVDDRINTAKNSAISTAASDATSKANSSLTSAKSYADTKKSEAINTAASDATSKANSAQTNATNSAKSYTDVQIKTVNQTITDKVAEIKLTTDSITQKVSSTETRITETNDKIDNLEIGGVNLLVQKSITKSKYLNNTGSTVDNSSWFYTDYINVSGFSNVRISGFTNLGASPSTCFYDASKNFIKGINNANSGNVAGITNKCELMDVPSNAVYMRCSGEIKDLSTLKIEKGTKITSYTPSPEDVNNSISTIDSKVTTTNNKVATIETNLNSITSRVSSTESSITSINGNITNLTNRMSSAEQKITSDAIVSTVTSSSKWNTLNSTATTANSTANTALTNSNTAQTTANTANTTANKVNNQINQSKQNVRCNDLGAKINYSAFSTANSGEMYLHGYDSNNNPTDTNGKIYWNGTTLTVVKGMLNPNSSFPFNTDVFIFVNKNSSSSNVYGSYYNTSTKTWAYVQLIGGTGSSTNWTPTKDHVAIGQFNMSEAEVFNYAYLYETPQPLVNLTLGNIDVLSRINSAEQKITSEAILNSVNTQIGNGGQISTTSTILDKTGFTVKNGALKVQNNAGTTVLEGDSSGNLTMKNGCFKVLSSSSSEIASINQNNWMRLQGLELFGAGECMQNKGTGVRSMKLISTDGKASHIDFNENSSVEYTVRLIREASSKSLTLLGNGMTLLPYTANTACGLEIRSQANWAFVDFTANSTDDYHARLYLKNNDKNIYTAGTGLVVQGNLSVTGSKNCLQATKNYGERLINAYETAECYYGDLGFGKINSDGECVVYIDDIFQECVNTDVEYHVFTQAYNGAIQSIERFNTYFIVKGTAGTEFSWEIKAKRIGHENNRLDLLDIDNFTVDGIKTFKDEELLAETVEDTLLDILTFDLEKILMEG